MTRQPLTAAALLVTVSLVAPSGPSFGAETPPATRTFQSWTATCDNLKSCVALATAQDDLFYIRIARAAGAEAAPDVKIVLAAQDPQKGAAPAFRLTAIGRDGKQALGPFPATTAAQDASVLSATLAAGAPSLAFIEAIRDAASLDYAVLANHGSLDLGGLSAALRFIDAEQGRQDTPGALVARGTAPDAQVPQPPAAPLVTAAPAGSVVAIDKPSVPQALIALAAPSCDPEVVKDQSEAEAWRLSPDTTLWALACTQGAYNIASALFLADANGSNGKPAMLPRPAALKGEEAGNVAENVSFDPKTMELQSFDKGRGLGDCGSTATWLWNGRAFDLYEAAMLDSCPGALPEDWPSIYAARRQ